MILDDSMELVNEPILRFKLPKIGKGGLLFDFVIQVLFVVIFVIADLLYFANSKDFLAELFLLLPMAVIGPLQLLSGLVFTISGSHLRRYYWLAVLVYALLIGGGLFLTDGAVVLIFAFFILAQAISFAYAGMSYYEWKKAASINNDPEL